VVKWLTRWAANPLDVGSNPTPCSKIMKKLLPLLLLLFVVGCDAFKQPPTETATGTVMEIIPDRAWGDAVVKLESGEIVRFNTGNCAVWKDAVVTITFIRSQGRIKSYIFPTNCFVK
jgi:hypothetical protein